jgi:arabinogalactan endo-1,4-beta-galactosidase
MRRRAFMQLTSATLLAAMSANACSITPAPAPTPPSTLTPTPPPFVPPWRGADISFTLQEEAIGTKLRSATGHPDLPIERILADSGATIARLRVWVNPPPGYSDQASLLTLARRIHTAGLELLLDFHYSDFWADPSAQTTPAAWARESLDQLTRTVHDYSRHVVDTLVSQGTPPRIVQIGNEVSNGMLWPAGRVHSAGETADWSNFGALLRSGISGVRAALPSAQTMLHIQCTQPTSTGVSTVRSILGEGVDFDILGLSYYPFWHGPLTALRDMLIELEKEFGKDLMVVETAYPWTLDGGSEAEIIVSTASSLPEPDRFPPTPKGQAAYFAALKTLIAGVPRRHGIGFLDWEPGYISTVGAHPGLGNPYNNLTMFDKAGNGLPALDVFADTL